MDQKWILQQSTHGYSAPQMGHSATGSDGTFILKPFTKWSKATGSTANNNKLLKHKLTIAHRQAVSHAEMATQVEKRGSVVSQLQSAIKTERVKIS